MVSQECAFDEGGDVFLFVGGELVDGFELEPQGLALGAAFVGVEDEVVGGDGECDGECAEHVEGRLVPAS